MISSPSKAKIIWQCRRGMLELDLILNRFVSEQWEHLTAGQIRAFEKLLTCSDPDIYVWLIGSEMPLEQELIEIVAFIRRQYRL